MRRRLNRAEGPPQFATPRLGIGWRPELARDIEARAARGALGFVELLAEDFDPRDALPAPVRELIRRGVAAIPHGTTLSLAGAEPLDRRRLDALARLAEKTGAPFVSEHVAFVRGGGRETGHLIPPPQTREALGILIENARAAVAALPVPLALENVACPLDWPDPEMSEGEFLRELLEESGALLLLDVENVYADARNRGRDPFGALAELPLDRVAYVHVAGGVERGGVYRDTHAHPVPREVLALLEEAVARASPFGAMLERDDRFPSTGELEAELDAIASAMERGARRRMTSRADFAAPAAAPPEAAGMAGSDDG